MKPARRVLRWGPLCFCDPVLLCGALYVLLYFDASGFLRLGLAAAFLHEWGHIAVYLLLRRRFPCMDVTMTGFCMRTRGEAFAPGETLLLAAAGPGMNALLAAVWAVRLSQCATIRGSAFLAANLLTGAFNLLPIPPLDGSSILALVVPRKHLPKSYRVQQYAMPVFLIVLIVLPYVLHVDPIGIYLDATAGNVANLLFPFKVS